MEENYYYKKVGYNFLSISNIIPASFDSDGNKIEQSELGNIKLQEEYYKYIQLLSVVDFSCLSG